MEAWGIRHRAILDRIVAGDQPWRPQSPIFIDAFRDVMHEIGVDVSALPQTALQDLGRFLLDLRPWPDSKDGIRMLRLVRPVALYSLSPLEVIGMHAAEADISFDHLFSAEASGSLPPAPEGFAAGAASVGVFPEEAVFISSHPPMLRGASKAGMQIMQIERPIRESRVMLFEPTRDLHLLGRFRTLPRAAEWLAANLPR